MRDFKIYWTIIDSSDGQIKWLLLKLHGRCCLPRVCAGTGNWKLFLTDASSAERAVRPGWETWTGRENVTEQARVGHSSQGQG